MLVSIRQAYFAWPLEHDGNSTGLRLLCREKHVILVVHLQASIDLHHLLQKGCRVWEPSSKETAGMQSPCAPAEQCNLCSGEHKRKADAVSSDGLHE